jgi:predicted sulfurtransferase
MNRASILKIGLFSGAMVMATAILTLPLMAAEVSKITKDDLKAMLDNPDVVILDVRTGKDWSASEFKIKGAVRANPREFNSWADTYPKDKKLVFYCA